MSKKESYIKSSYNELVNKEFPSPSANLGVRKFLIHLNNNPKKEYLGIEGNGPEKSIYLNILSKTGLHRKMSDNSFALQSPDKEINLKQLWENWDKIIKKSEIKRPSIMKLDVQGYELEVLKGSKNLLKNIDFIITEISFKKIYKNQVTRKKLLKFLNKNNFKSKKMLNISKMNNNLFQGDILFAKSK